MKIGRGEFWLGDCLEFMQRIPSGSVDCIVTDPPYPVISGGNKSNRSLSISLGENDGKIFQHNDTDCSLWMPEAFRILKDETHVYVMTNFLNLQVFMSTLQQCGFYLHNLLVWQKNNVTPNRWYMKNVEYTIFAKKGKAKSINDAGSKTCHAFDNPRDKLHPTEKPIELMQMYLTNSSQAGDLILDPFAGSGTTAIAAERTDRRWICIEKDPAYYYGAVGRVWSECN